MAHHVSGELAGGISMKTETEICCYCQEPIEVYIDEESGGVISRPEYVLIADWVAHTKCLDDSLAKYEADECPRPAIQIHR